MSNAIYPTLPGLGWSMRKSPEFKTTVLEAVSGKETRGSYWAYPRWNIELTYEVLREQAAYTEFQTLCGFFLSRGGAFDDFLLLDPDDNSVTAQVIGTGNGSTTAFQVTRTMGGYTEIVQNLNGAPSVYLNGVLQATGYTVGATGIITFTAPPGVGVVVTVTANFYYRVRFKDDIQEFEQFMKRLWSAKKVLLKSVKL